MIMLANSFDIKVRRTDSASGICSSPDKIGFGEGRILPERVVKLEALPGRACGAEEAARARSGERGRNGNSRGFSDLDRGRR